MSKDERLVEQKTKILTEYWCRKGRVTIPWKANPFGDQNFREVVHTARDTGEDTLRIASLKVGVVTLVLTLRVLYVFGKNEFEFWVSKFNLTTGELVRYGRAELKFLDMNNFQIESSDQKVEDWIYDIDGED